MGHIAALLSLCEANQKDIKRYRETFKLGEVFYTKSDQPVPFLVANFGDSVVQNEAIAARVVVWSMHPRQFVDDMLEAGSRIKQKPKVAKNPVDMYTLAVLAADSIYEAKSTRSAGYIVLDSQTLQPAKMSVTGLRTLAGADYYNEVMVPTARCYNHVFDSVSKHWVSRPCPDEPEILEVNAYLPPSIYGLNHPISSQADMSAIKTFLTYLVPDKEQRLWLYSWMAHAVTTRAKTILCLVGKEATGKTTFANLMKNLVCGFDEYSASYFFKGSSRFLSDRFSGHLLNKRLVFLDEFQMLNRNHLDKLKDIIEDDANREAKFQNQITHKNTLSFIIANNWTSALWIHPATGRKFSVPDIAEESLTEKFSREFLEKLNDQIQDPSAICKLYRNLVANHLERYRNDEPLHGATYEQITRVSAPAFIQTILKNEIDECKTRGQQWEIEDLMINYKDKQWSEARAVSEIVDFFKSFKQNKKPACEIFTKKGKPFLKITDEYFNYLLARREINTEA